MYLLTEVENEQDLTLIAEKIIASIQMPCSVTVDDVTINPCISASMGIAIFPKDGATPQALVRSADKAMYRAKASKTQYSFVQ